MREVVRLITVRVKLTKICTANGSVLRQPAYVQIAVQYVTYYMFDPTFCLTYSELESRNGPGYIDYMDEMEGICSQEFGEMGKVGTNMHMNVFNILS